MFHARRSPPLLFALVVVLALAFGTGVALGQSSDAETAVAEQALAEKYRPIVQMKQQREACDSRGEAWDPAPVEIVLVNPEVELLGPDGQVVTTAPTAKDLFEAGPDFNLNFPGDSLNPGCRYEQDGQRFKEGRPDVVYAHVATEEGVTDRIVLQYWFYWYFNDFNNTHESDWEMMQIIFPASSAEQALEVMPIEVGFAQHGGGERADWTDSKLQRDGVRPIVYPAAGSHATYFDDVLYLGRGPSEGFGCDDSTGPHRRGDPEPRLIPTEVSGPNSPVAWVAWEGRWGQRQRGSFDGPTGPITKKQWSEPITWQDGLRDRSVEVPASTAFGPDVTGIFCEGVAIGSSVFVAFTESPLVGLLVLGTIVVLLGGAARGTTWTPASPIPVRAVRGIGQILLAARGMYSLHPATFIVAGLVFVPLSLGAAGIQAVLLDLEPFSATDEATGDNGGFTLSLAPLVGALAATVAAAIINAVVAGAVKEVEAGRSATVGASFRTMWRSLRCFAPPVAGAVLTLALLTVTIVGIPVAIWMGVRWVFITQSAVIDGRCGWDAPRRSVDVVRGRWIRTAVPVFIINAIAIGIGSVVGLALLLTTSFPLVTINLIGALVYALLIPYAALATTYLYLSNSERARQ